MNEDVNFLDNLDRISTSFYTQNNDSFNKNNEKNEKDVKKVKFHKKLTVITVESYKQYNILDDIDDELTPADKIKKFLGLCDTFSYICDYWNSHIFYLSNEC